MDSIFANLPTLKNLFVTLKSVHVILSLPFADMYRAVKMSHPTMWSQLRLKTVTGCLLISSCILPTVSFAQSI